MSKITHFSEVLRQYICEYRGFTHSRISEQLIITARGIREARELVLKRRPEAYHIEIELFHEIQCDLWVAK